MDLGIFQVHDAEVVPFGLLIVIGPTRLASLSRYGGYSPGRGEIPQGNRVNPMGTGPFKLVEWKRNAYIKWVKFYGYWQKGKPYLDGIETRALSCKN